MKPLCRSWAARLAAFAAFGGVLSACSVGSGTGSAAGSLDVNYCWSGCYDLKPNFFGASPYNMGVQTDESTTALTMELERGSDYSSFSDGIEILVDSIGEVPLGRPIPVGLAPGVVPPGIPITPEANPPIVHASLYLQETCPTEDIALYAVSAVALGPGGSCSTGPSSDDGGTSAATSDESDGGIPFATCAGNETLSSEFSDAGGDGALGEVSDGGDDAGAVTSDAGDAGTAIAPGASWIEFDSIFDGDPDESLASKRLISGSFEFFLADPRQMAPSGKLPPPCLGHVKGTFSYYFERGQPAQPFP